jgi:hypothetical protein
MNREELERLVRAVATEVIRSLPQASPSAEAKNAPCPCGGRCGGNPPPDNRKDEVFRFQGKLLSDESLGMLPLNGCRTLALPQGAIVTPLARDRLRRMGVSIAAPFRPTSAPPRESSASRDRSLAFFVGRSGITAERAVRSAAEEAGWNPSGDSLPPGRNRKSLERALECVRRVASGRSERGVVVGENIYGVLRIARVLPGVRPLVCWDASGALRGRREQDANVLLLSDQLGLTNLGRIVSAWLSE